MANVDITRIASNIGALNTLMSLEVINRQLSTHQARLASGKRINNAADDPAGLTIATKLQARAEGLKVALNNISDAKNLLAVAEAGVGRINDILVQMRNKAEAAASDTMGQAERAAIMSQLRAYANQVDDLVAQTEWNGNKLIDGTYDATALTFQTGAGSADITSVDGLKNIAGTGANSLKLAFKAAANTGAVAYAGQVGSEVLAAATTAITPNGAELAETGVYTVKVTVDSVGGNEARLYNSAGTELAVSSTPIADGGTATFDDYFAVDLAAALPTLDGTYVGYVGYTKEGDYDIMTDGSGEGATATYMATAAQFNEYMTYVEGRLNIVSSQMARLGAFSGRLTFKEDQVMSAHINTEASYSRIMNANMAEEQVNASKFLILQQTATAMLAQANAAPQFILQLFR